MQQVIQYYNTGRVSGLFPPATSIVLAAMYQRNVALPDMVETIRRVLVRLGLRVIYREYRVREQGQARSYGETSFIMQRQEGQEPRVFVNNELLYVEDSEDNREEEGEEEGEGEGEEGGEGEE